MREAGAAMCKQFRDAGELENNHVHEVYRKIAPFFHNAKYKAWPIVRQFLNRFPKSSLILDVGKFVNFFTQCSFTVLCW